MEQAHQVLRLIERCILVPVEVADLLAELRLLKGTLDVTNARLDCACGRKPLSDLRSQSLSLQLGIDIGIVLRLRQFRRRPLRMVPSRRRSRV